MWDNFINETGCKTDETGFITFLGFKFLGGKKWSQKNSWSPAEIYDIGDLIKTRDGYHNIVVPPPRQGCQIFLGLTFQNWEKIPNGHKIY
jgi:hypothetical protein